MSKITPIHWKKFAKIFESDGWNLSRIKGDHLIYTKEGFIRPVVIPKDNEVEIFIILNNLKTAHISREKYFEFLRKI